MLILILGVLQIIDAILFKYLPQWFIYGDMSPIAMKISMSTGIILIAMGFIYMDLRRNK